MKKIPTIYERDPETNLRHVMDERHPDCGWVFDGEGVPTYKWDGTAVKVSAVDGSVWKRREVKAGREAPHTFEQEGEVDPVTGKRVGWVLADFDAPEDRWLAEAFENAGNDLAPGTYELVGPKVQGNPHEFEAHRLLRHGQLPFGQNLSASDPLSAPPTEFTALGRWLHDLADANLNASRGFEGVVWHHPDGRMAKIKVRDFPKP